MFDLKIPFNLTLCYEEFNSFTKLFEREREREREREGESVKSSAYLSYSTVNHVLKRSEV